MTEKTASKLPLLAGLGFASNSLFQIIKIWHTRHSESHSVLGWINLTISLILLLVFYHICCPKERYMFWSTVIEILINIFLIVTVLIF